MITLHRSLATFSTPFSRHIYFVRAAESYGEVRFGGFGWCNVSTGECWGPRVGYHYDPQVTVWLTGAEVTIGIGTHVFLDKLMCMLRI
jgi:hypothetical protein